MQFPWGSDVLRVWLNRQLVSTAGQVIQGEMNDPICSIPNRSFVRRSRSVVCAVSAWHSASERFGEDAAEAERLGSVEDFATKADVEAVRMAFMQKVNGAQTSPHPSMTLSEFSEQFYLPWVERELRASTYKGYRDIWNLYLSERVGQIRLRRFRTVDASKMLRALRTTAI